MTDSDLKTPNAHHLSGDSILPAEIIDLTSDLACFNISMLPFTNLKTLEMPFNQNDPLPFGTEATTCSQLHQAYITFFSCAPTGHLLHINCCSFIGSYIISISDIPGFHVTDLDLILCHLCSQDEFPPQSVTIIIAPEQCSSFDDCPSAYTAASSWSTLHCCSMVDNRAAITDSWICHCSFYVTRIIFNWSDGLFCSLPSIMHDDKWGMSAIKIDSMAASYTIQLECLGCCLL